MADGEHDRRGRAGDAAEVVRECEDGPAVGDGAEGGVAGVRELAVVDELRAHDGVLAVLPGCADSL